MRRSRCAMPCTVCSLQHIHLQVGDDANIPLYCRQDQVSRSRFYLVLQSMLHDSGSACEWHGEESTSDEKGSNTNEIGGHAPSNVPSPRSIDLHTPPRLHGAIATRLQAIITGSGVDFGPQASCPTMLSELRDTDTRLKCCVDTLQASVTYRSEFTLRDAVMVGGRGWQAH